MGTLRLGVHRLEELKVPPLLLSISQDGDSDASEIPQAGALARP